MTRVFVAQPIERVPWIVPRFHRSRLGLQREVLEVVQKANKVIWEDTLFWTIESNPLSITQRLPISDI